MWLIIPDDPESVSSDEQSFQSQGNIWEPRGRERWILAVDYTSNDWAISCSHHLDRRRSHKGIRQMSSIAYPNLPEPKTTLKMWPVITEKLHLKESVNWGKKIAGCQRAHQHREKWPCHAGGDTSIWIQPAEQQNQRRWREPGGKLQRDAPRCSLIIFLTLQIKNMA